ncbi:MAG: hypothetical protein VX546_07380 [Myxococcota bacterium]|nr:hypothetical protein [Myxococcota bacterium]
MSAGTRFLLLAAAATVLLYPLAYADVYAGDAVIHLIYAENAARGHFYEFNLGEVTAGVTSTGYMLLLAGLFRLLPAPLVPIAAKLLGALAWFASLAFVYAAARRWLHDWRWAAAAALTCGLLPGSVHNANVGMETPFFLLWTAGWLALAARWDWFDGAAITWRRELLAGALLGFGFWLRPEAVLVSAAAFPVRALSVARLKGPGAVFGALLPGAAAALAVAGVALGFHYYHSGLWLPTSGRSRMYLATLTSWRLGPFLFDPAFAKRLLAYAPLTALFLLGSVRLLRQRSGWGRFVVLLFVFGFGVYSFLTGAHHLSRYTAFLFPGFVLVAAAGAQGFAAAFPVRRRLILGSLATIVAVLFVAEGTVRVFNLDPRGEDRLGRRGTFGELRNAPLARQAHSEAWLERLGQPRERPIVLAMQEVDLRYYLDNRFVVRSLDGRVDPLLLEFAAPDYVDHIGYFRARGVHFLLDAPNYIPEYKTRFSIAWLRGLDPGAHGSHEGMRFERLNNAAAWRLRENRNR